MTSQDPRVSARAGIDFIEDPSVFSPGKGFGPPCQPPANGASLYQKGGATFLALDRGLPALFSGTADGTGPAEGPPDVPQVLVLKPATQAWKPVLQAARLWHKRLVVTSYLDHPLGQLGAAWIAARAAAQAPGTMDICGLLSHSAYEPTAFSEALSVSGPLFRPRLEEPGLGLGRLLEKLDWRQIGGA